jgi:hypothetical protein
VRRIAAAIPQYDTLRQNARVGTGGKSQRVHPS